MSLENYNKLQHKNAEAIGIKLPVLTAAHLKRQTDTLNLANTLARINDFSADTGWLMQSDKVTIQSNSNKIDTDSPLIEAQFNKGNSSLHIKLVNNGQYSVVELTSDSVESNPQQNSAYSEQALFLRNDLADKSANTLASYRLWWQQETSGNNDGRWQVIAQQFMGFSADSLVDTKKENAS